MIAPQIGELTGGGTVSAQKALALKMKVNLHTSGVLTTAAGSTLSTGGIPFSVGGTVDNPQIHPEVGAVVKEVAKDVGKDAGKTAVGLLNNFLVRQEDQEDRR